MKRDMGMSEAMPDVEPEEQKMTRIIHIVQSLSNHAGDMRSQVENVGDRMFGPEPTIDSGMHPSDEMHGDIDQIMQCLEFLGGRMNGLQAQIRRIETL
tara:strand:+ start:29602 stop:29895 length:294 start_codon:yes stop_codon:yes gene_type:complete